VTRRAVGPTRRHRNAERRISHDRLATNWVITDLEAKELILRKHHDLVADQLNRYLSAEKRGLLGIFENLWAKYAVPNQHLEAERKKTLEDVQHNLSKLKYLP
jgi:type I restriction enzyme M protein